MGQALRRLSRRHQNQSITSTASTTTAPEVNQKRKNEEGDGGEIAGEGVSSNISVEKNVEQQKSTTATTSKEEFSKDKLKEASSDQKQKILEEDTSKLAGRSDASAKVFG